MKKLRKREGLRIHGVAEHEEISNGHLSFDDDINDDDEYEVGETNTEYETMSLDGECFSDGEKAVVPKGFEDFLDDSIGLDKLYINEIVVGDV